MTQLLKSLKRENLILDEQHSLMKHNFGGVAMNLFENELQNLKCSRDMAIAILKMSNNLQ